MRYLSDFTGSAGVLLLGREPPDTLITDARYDAQARDEADPGIDVEIAADPALVAARARLLERGTERVLLESEHVSAAVWEEWRAEAPGVEGARGWVEALRAIKSEAELGAIVDAARVVDAAFEAILETLRPGVGERVAALELDRRLIEHGADRPAFDTIVAFGERTALPHARPGARRLQPGDIVLIDCGAVIDGYCSDLTRTVACGDPGETLRGAYDVVLEAQRAAIRGIRPGMSGRQADALARDVIAEAGHGERFGHSLGHGLGLEVHESPRLSRKSEDDLAVGMVVTVEPGIYIAGKGGVRIEDDVVLGAEGARPLTRAPKETLLVL